MALSGETVLMLFGMTIQLHWELHEMTQVSAIQMLNMCAALQLPARDLAILAQIEAVGQARGGCWFKSSLAASSQRLLANASVLFSYVERICTLRPGVSRCP